MMSDTRIIGDGRSALTAQATGRIGVSGFHRNATAAAVRDGRLEAVCEQARLTRVRNVGIAGGGFPLEAVHMVSALARLDDPLEWMAAEAGIAEAAAVPVTNVDHHRAHAAAAFLTSGWERAAVVVVDSGPRQVSVWRANAHGLTECVVAWQGPGPCDVYRRLCEALGWTGQKDEREVEALAGIGRPASDASPALRVAYRDGRLQMRPGFLSNTSSKGSIADRASVAAVVQQALIEACLEFLSEMATVTGERRLCLGGGFFYNTAVNTAVRRSGLFDDVFVPVDPGNPGLAAGCALYDDPARVVERATPFLGPAFDNEEVKRVLDNCKLGYEHASDEACVDRVVQALARGRLVGWFQGRLEWGPRALGNRSILASPLAPYALENLNAYLKQRPAYRTYGVSVPRRAADRWFRDAGDSPFMECEFVASDARLSVLGSTAHARVRVQTVEPSAASRLHVILDAFGEETGVPVLVNTSFNGFHEPIVCTPRDAVRVFYGTGLDLLVIGNFILEK